MKETIIDNDHVTLWYHPKAKIVHHRFKKYIYGEPFRQVMLEGLRVFQEHGARKWLSDDRENNALPKADGEWAQTVWAPKVIEAGWAFWAIALPKKVVGQMNMQRWAAKFAEVGVSVELFDDPDRALSWLKRQKLPS